MESTEEQTLPEKSKEEDPRTFVVSFFKEARKLFAKEDLETALWITKKGVFLRNDFTNRVIEIFQRWFQGQIGEGIPYSFEKAEKKLFHEEARKEFYILSGNSVVVGNLLDCQTNDLRGCGVRLYEGIPLDTATNLHHADPVFSEGDNLKAVLGRDGYAAVVAVKEGTLTVPFDLFPKLREYFIHSGEMRKYITAKNLRSLVQSFCRSLHYLKPLGKKQLLLVPSHLGDGKGTNLWCLHTLLLVEQDGCIKEFLPLVGKAHDGLVREELMDMAKNPRVRRIGGASISLVKGSFLAHAEVSGIHHKFGVSVVLAFIEELHEFSHWNHGHLPGRLKSHYTVREVVSEISFLLKEASPCMPDKIPGRVREKAHRDSMILVSKGEWFFEVDRTKMIRSVHYMHKPPKKEVHIVPQRS